MDKYASYIKEGEAWGIIPARSGSKGIRDKNIRCLKGYPLLAYAIAAGKLAKEISRIIVTTDSPYYARVANHYGGETPFLRPAEISGDEATDQAFMDHAIRWFAENERRLPEYFVHIRTTCPLREVSVMDAAVAKMKSDPTATSLRSSHLSAETPFKWFNIRADGYYKPLIGGMTVDAANNPRQSFPAVYIPDGYVDVLRTRFIIESHLMHGDRSIGFIVPEGVDIDLMQDFDRVSDYIRSHRSGLYDYLSENFRPLDSLSL